MIEKETPEIIRNHVDSWFWTKQWRKVHTKHQQSCGAVVGAPGSGKSYAVLSSAELLDRAKDGDTRFSMDQVAFSAQDFFEQINRGLPIGSCVVLDDAAIIAYSADALTKSVKLIAKAFQSQRHLRRIVFLTLPVLPMLSKVCIQTLGWYVEMMTLDETLQQSRAKLQRIQTNSKTGKTYFKRYTVKKYTKHNVVNMVVQRKCFRPDLTFSMPSPKLVKLYEKSRSEAMKKHYEEAERITKGKKKKKENTFVNDYRKIENNLEAYLDDRGRLDKGKMLLDGIPHSNAAAIKKLFDDKKKNMKKNKEV